MTQTFPSLPLNEIQDILTKIVESVTNLELVASRVTDPVLGDLLAEIADFRRERIEDLSWLLAGAGATPGLEVSHSFMVYQAWYGFVGQLVNFSDSRLLHECELQGRKLAHRIATVSKRADRQAVCILAGISSELLADAELMNRFRTIKESYGDAEQLEAELQLIGVEADAA